MEAPKPSLSLDETKTGYVLRKTDASGSVSELHLSDDDVLTLGQSSPNFRQKILAKRTPASGGVTPVFATNVVQIGLAPDTLGEDILLTLVAPNGSQTTFALPPHIAQHLSERLPTHLASLSESKLGKA
jgi:hypothetical protein